MRASPRLDKGTDLPRQSYRSPDPRRGVLAKRFDLFPLAATDWSEAHRAGSAGISGEPPPATDTARAGKAATTVITFLSGICFRSLASMA